MSPSIANADDNHDLLARVEHRRSHTMASLDETEQKLRAQYFTPREVAEIMAQLPIIHPTKKISVLDPGAGNGILSAALIVRITREHPEIEVELTAVENDAALYAQLRETLVELSQATGARTCHVDSSFLNWALETDKRFDLIIQNPPYKKLASNSSEQELLREHGVFVPNIYAAFVELGIRLLKPNGQQVSITPRSWMNGTYYGAFRDKLIRCTRLTAIHTFESRSSVFSDSGVLQESIIVLITKGGQEGQVLLSTSFDHRETPQQRFVDYADVVTEDFIHVPTTSDDSKAVHWLNTNATSSLTDLGLKVSTGRVVGFRSRENLRDVYTEGCLPLLLSTHLSGGIISHPISSKKPEWFEPDSEQTTRMLVPPGCYVLIKRFSAKEEKRRVCAAVWNSTDKSAFDNKLNFIHVDGEGVDPAIAHALALYLNSSQLDTYFRVFSGHTQVNAGDLRKLPFPTSEQLRRLSQMNAGSQEEIDQAVTIVLSNKEE